MKAATENPNQEKLLPVLGTCSGYLVSFAFIPPDYAFA